MTLRLELAPNPISKGLLNIKWRVKGARRQQYKASKNLFPPLVLLQEVRKLIIVLSTIRFRVCFQTISSPQTA